MQANNRGKSAPAGTAGGPAAKQFFLSSVAQKAAGDLAWLGQAAGNSDSLGPHQKDLAIMALDAVFADYGG